MPGISFRSTLQIAGWGLLVLGALAVASSWAVPQRYWQQSAWGRDEAEQYLDSSSSLHQLVHRSSHQPNDPRLRAELQRARERFERQQQQLEAARAAGPRRARILRFAGLASMLAGFGILRIAGSSNSDDAGDWRR